MTTRLAIDWDADGAFAVITRAGQPSEMIRLPDVDRLATEAMTAALAMRGRVVVRPARWPREDGPEHFIGALGE